jgi:hypothetical protein
VPLWRFSLTLTLIAAFVIVFTATGEDHVFCFCGAAGTLSCHEARS